MKRLLVLAHILAAPMILHAEPAAQMRVQVSPREAYVGDVIDYQLTLIFTPELKERPLQVPNPIGTFELLNYSSSTVQETKDGKKSQEHRLAITVFSTGTQTIPSLSVSFTGPDGKVMEAKTEPIDVKIKSLLEEKGDLGNLRPLKGLYDFRSYFWLWLLLSAALLGGGAYFIATHLKKRRRGAAPQGPPRPPEEIAWEALRELEKSDLLSQGHSKEFYYRLAVILRSYLEGRFGFSALERTTSELLAEFRRLNVETELMGLARDFLGDADLVKFAKFTPNEDDIENDLFRVKKMITLTTPQKTEIKEVIPV